VLTPNVEYTDGEVELPAWCSVNYSEKSKLFRWIRAALAGDFNPNADFQAIKLIKRRILVNVEKNASANGGEFNRITDILVAPHGSLKRTPTVRQEPPQPPEPPALLDDIP
jgi:hypothetical protein